MKVNLIGISPYSLSSVSPHSHNDWEIVLNLEGEGTSVIGDAVYPFYPGTILCHPPNAPHSKVSNQKFRDIFIRVNHFINPTNKEAPIFFDDEEKSFESLMLFALRIFHKKETNYVFILNSLYDTLQQLLLGWSKVKPKNENVELFKNELILNFTNPEFQISDAVKKTSYSDDYFRRSFKKDTGTTPIAYLINLRIEYAKQLLTQKDNTRMTISEISLLSGFYDSHYFSRLFKNKVGKTPQDYAEEQRSP